MASPYPCSLIGDAPSQAGVAPQNPQRALENRGYSVETWTYVDDFCSWARGDKVLAYGFLVLLSEIS